MSQIEERNKMIRAIMRVFGVGYARAAHIYSVLVASTK